MCPRSHLHNKRDSPVRGEVESYTTTIGYPFHGMQRKRTKRLQLSRTTSTSTNVDNMLENGRTKISYKFHESHMKTSLEKHARICMLTMFVTHENKNQRTRETKVHLPQRTGKTLTEISSALPVAALGRSIDFRTKSRLPQPQI